jgi:hypothetical protein
MSTQKQIIEEFKKKFGVSVVAAKDSLEIDVAYLEADEEKTSAYIESFLSKELSLYSKKVLKKSNLRKIILCKNLVSSGKKRAGLAEPKWIFSVLLGNNILINVDAPLDSYARSVIHHELYHLIDDSDDINGMYDNHWKKLNHPNFIYKDDHLPNQLFKASSKGFVSTYAMTAVHEDKADTFSHMIVDYKGIEKLAKTDAVLRRKMERMKVLMNKFSSEFDDSFWRERAKMSERLVRY